MLYTQQVVGVALWMQSILASIHVGDLPGKRKRDTRVLMSNVLQWQQTTAVLSLSLPVVWAIDMRECQHIHHLSVPAQGLPLSGVYHLGGKYLSFYWMKLNCCLICSFSVGCSVKLWSWKAKCRESLAYSDNGQRSWWLQTYSHAHCFWRLHYDSKWRSANIPSIIPFLHFMYLPCTSYVDGNLLLRVESVDGWLSQCIGGLCCDWERRNCSSLRYEGNALYLHLKYRELVI